MHSLTPKAWASICKPNFIGGLGIRLTTHFNKAILCKLWWHLISEHNIIWKAFIFAKYLKNSFWLSISARPINSRFWKGLLKQRNFVSSSFYFQINNGTKAKVWFDAWIPRSTPANPTPLSSSILQDPQLRVSELIRDGTLFCYSPSSHRIL